VWRGVVVFADRPAPNVEQAAVLLGAGAGIAWGVRDAAGGSVDFIAVVMSVSLAIAWCLGRAAVQTARGLRDEFGRAALACAAPTAVLALMWLARGVLAPIVPHRVAQSVTTAHAANTVLVMGSLLLGLVVNATLVAMVIVRLVRRLQHASEHDVLTGLLNRRGMAVRLAAEEGRRARFGTGFALLSVDIDHFKRINDRYGHAAGDDVLAGVAATMARELRGVDTVARMGGEEFCVLLPGTDAAGAELTAQRLMIAVARKVYPDIDPGLQVTVSIGVATADDLKESMSALQRRLDAALYEAKAGGRNRAVFAPPTQAADL
jgi:diguanylate cyclase (GGDEF)-like protein